MANPKSTVPTQEQTQGTPDLLRQVMNGETGITMLMEMQATLGRLEERVNAQAEKVDERVKVQADRVDERLKAQADRMDERLKTQADRMDDRLKSLRELADAAATSQRELLAALLGPQGESLTSIKADVKDLIGWKNKLLGIAFGISVLSGLIAYTLNRVFPSAPPATPVQSAPLRYSDDRTNQDLDSNSSTRRDGQQDANERRDSGRRPSRDPGRN